MDEPTVDTEQGRSRAQELLFLIAFVILILVIAWLLLRNLGSPESPLDDSGDFAVVLVPNVVGLREKEAVGILEGAGFQVEKLGLWDRFADVGTVLEQSPEAGTETAPGACVAIEVAIVGEDAEGIPAGQPVTRVEQVPDVIGRHRSSAESIIDSNGFVAAVSEAYDASIPEEQVVSQMPAGGTLADPGTEVHIVVSLGAAPTSAVSVPDVYGLSESAARAKIESVGLVLYAAPRPASVPAGTVWVQWPEADSKVDMGATVYAFVGIH